METTIKVETIKARIAWLKAEREKVIQHVINTHPDIVAMNGGIYELEKQLPEEKSGEVLKVEPLELPAE